jgi:hypothetical protein
MKSIHFPLAMGFIITQGAHLCGFHPIAGCEASVFYTPDREVLGNWKMPHQQKKNITVLLVKSNPFFTWTNPGVFS